jgi:hypothetical protein
MCLICDDNSIDRGHDRFSECADRSGPGLGNSRALHLVREHGRQDLGVALADAPQLARARFIG